MKNILLVIAIVAVVSIGGGLWYFVSSAPTEVVSSNEESKERDNTAQNNEVEEMVVEKSCPNFNERTITVDDREFNIGIADTPEKRTLGLGGCTELASNEGLYFTLENKKETAFWMKGMLIPIDIIWILEGEVVGIEHNVQPPDNPDDTDLPIYESPQEVDAVLEIAAKQAVKQEIEVGSKISF